MSTSREYLELEQPEPQASNWAPVVAGGITLGLGALILWLWPDSAPKTAGGRGGRPGGVHSFQPGQRVQWAQRGPVACVAPPCMQGPGMVARVRRERVGDRLGGFVVGPSGIMVSVDYDNDFPFTDWPAELLEYVDDDGVVVDVVKTAGGSSTYVNFSQARLHFPNNFPDSTYLGISFPGLCGGMSYTALDFFNAGEAAPLTRVTPSTDSTLGAYIQSRQTDSLLSWQGARFIELLANPDDAALSSSTADELATLRGYLANKTPMPLGLIPAPYTLIATNAHQVVATGYGIGDDGSVTLFIWDPDYPSDAQARLFQAAGTNTWVEYGTKGPTGDQWRGWFVESDYTPQTPLAPGA